LIPFVFIIMAIMDGVAYQIITATAGPNAIWYLAGLGIVEVAMVVGMVKVALGE